MRDALSPPLVCWCLVALSPHPTPDPCGLPCLHPAWFSLALMQTCPEEGGGEGLWGGGVLKGIYHSAKLFLQRRNWNSPTPLGAGGCAPPHFGPGGEGTLACGKGVGGVPIPTRGHTLWCSVYVSTLGYLLRSTVYSTFILKTSMRC